MNFRNPYDSLIVLRALIQEIINQVSRAFHPDDLLTTSYDEIQKAVDDLSERVEFRGVPLRKLFAIVLRHGSLFEGKPALDFVLRPLSEDGRVYLRLLELAEVPGSKLPLEEVTRVHVRRIVEI